MSGAGAVVVADQNKTAFQKQDTIFLGAKRVLQKKVGKKDLRYVKSVGLGIKTPKEASEMSYVDKKCPFTGNVTIRGRLLSGTVKTTKMDRTIIIRRALHKGRQRTGRQITELDAILDHLVS